MTAPARGTPGTLTRLGTISDPASGTTSVTPFGFGTGVAVGDRLFVFVAYKRTDAGAPTIGGTGWTVAHGPSSAGTATAPAAQTGPVGFIAFTKLATAAGERAPDVTHSGTGAVMLALAVAYRAAAGQVVTWGSTYGGDATNNTTWTAVGQADPGLRSGDQLVILYGLTSTNSAIVTTPTPSHTAPGATIGAYSALATSINNTQGDALRMTSWAAPVTAGTATGPPTAAVSTSAAVTGQTLFFRVAAEVPPAAPTTVTGTGALTAGSPTLAGEGTVPPPTVTGAGDLTATAPTLAGAGTLLLAGAGALAAPAPTLTAAAVLGIAGAGALEAAAPTLTATGAARLTGAADLAAAPATLAGAGTLTAAVTGGGTLAASAPTLAATGALAVTATGALLAALPSLDGAGLLRLTAAGTLTAPAAALAGGGTVVDERERRDITVTVGTVTTRTLTATAASRTLTAGPPRTRTLTARRTDE